MQAIGLIGGLVQGIAGAQQASYQSAIAKVNAQQERYNAEAAAHAAEMDVLDIGKQAAGERGTLLANQASTGISLSSPSFVEGIKAHGRRAYESAVRRQFAGNAQFAAYQTRANVEDARAKMAAAAAPLAFIGGLISGLGSLVGSAQPTIASPGYLPIPTQQALYGNIPSAYGGFGGLY